MRVKIEGRDASFFVGHNPGKGQMILWHDRFTRAQQTNSSFLISLIDTMYKKACETE
jgi:hypothetical protein